MIDRTPWEFGGKILRASSAFVEPIVFTHREPERGSDEETARGPGGKRERKDAFPIDEEWQAHYERKRQAGRNEEKRWEQVVRARGQLRLSIIGEPGGGKTCATRHTVAQLARESIRMLRENAEDVSEVIVPLWITSRHLAEQPADQEAAGAVFGALELQPGLRGAITPFLRAWLRERLDDPTMFLVIDALDELHEPDAAGAFARHLEALGSLALSLVVTYRTLPWERLRRMVPWDSEHRAVELKPLEPTTQKAFAAKLLAFIGRGGLESELDQRLSRAPPLREHARTPLILTFACLLLAEGTLSGQAGLAPLYRALINALLEGRWRKTGRLPAWTANNIHRERVRSFLGPICWQIFQRAPASNRFSLAEWDQSWEMALAHGKAPQIHSDTLLDDLVRIGLVVDGGIDEKGCEFWSFAHRTVLEFLAAEGLSKDEKKLRWLLEVQKPIEENPFWFHPEWLPTLTFLASVAGDATALVKAVEIPPLLDGAPAPGDDIFCQMLELQCRFVGAAPETPDEVAEWVLDKWTYHWGLRWWRRRSRVGFWDIWTQYGCALGGHPVFERCFISPMVEQMQREDAYEMCSTAHLLVSLGFRKGLDILLTQLQREVDGNKRFYLRSAIKRFDDLRSVKPLLENLSHETHWTARRDAIKILGGLGDDSVIPVLIQCLEQNTTEQEVEAVIDALAEISSPHVIDHLFRCLEADSYRETRWHISRALAELLCKISFEKLAIHLDHRAILLRGHIAVKLGESRDSRAIQLLAGQFEKENQIEIMVSILEALARFGDKTCVPKILELFDQEIHPWYKYKLSEMFGNFLGPSLVEPLLLQLQRGNGNAIELLGKIGDRRAIEPIGKWLDVPGYRRRAAAALRSLGTIEFSSRMRRRFRQAKDLKTRLEIAVALADSGDLRALRTLVRGMRKTKFWDQREVVGACSEFHEPALVQTLIAQLKLIGRSKRPNDMYVRRDLAETLGKLGDPRAIEPILSQLAGKEHRHAREVMVKALFSLAMRNRRYIPAPGFVVPPRTA